MSMIIGRCTSDGCTVLTIGSHCVEHELPVARTFPRGRPFAKPTATATPAVITRPGSVGSAPAPVRRTADTFTLP